MKMNPSSLFRPGLSNIELRQRTKLVVSGNLFHIPHADIFVTDDGIQKLGRFFEPANVHLAQVKNLFDLATAYTTWQLTAPDSERARLRLRAGRGCIPSDATAAQRLERRVLLTLAPHLDIGMVSIVLTAEGRTAFAGLCALAGTTPEKLTTLAALVQLADDATQAGASRLGLQPMA